SDVSLATIVMSRSRVARLLAEAVERGEYSFEPGELRTIRARNKMREVFSCRLTDLIVHGVVANLVQEAVAADVSPRVFSYRKGLASLTPITQFARYLRTERRQHDDPRKRGVYVLRCDVDSYTDSIPIGRDSPLWAMLEARLGAPLHPLVEKAVRVELELPDAGVACRIRGLPMGQPIASVVANLYLGEMDRALQDVPGAFYARYGDDFLFAHPEPDVVQEAEATITGILASLRLTSNEKKRRRLYLTPPGRPSAEWPGATGAPYVPYLGTLISAEGTIALDGKKVRTLLREISERAQATVKTMNGADPDTLGKAVCAVVNRSLDPESALAQQRSAILLRRVVTDRRQLEQLDYWVARVVVAALTRRSHDVRAFRQVPYRKLRGEWGLRSLVAARNRQ